MRCGYCYYLDKPAPGEAVMTEAVLERFVAQVIAASPGPVVSFTWHGASPPWRGLPFYRRAVALQRQYLPEGWRCWNNLQTNGLLLDEAWCAFLAREGFDVGLSLDGDRLIHDAQRRDLAGAGTYDRAAEAARRLMDHGLKPDLLCARSRRRRRPAAPGNLSGAAGAGHGLDAVSAHRAARGGRGERRPVSPEAYGEFLCRVFDRWCLFDLGRTGVQLFAEAARTLAGGRAALCTLTETCGQVLVVEEGRGGLRLRPFCRPGPPPGQRDDRRAGRPGRRPNAIGLRRAQGRPARGLRGLPPPGSSAGAAALRDRLAGGSTTSARATAASSTTLPTVWPGVGRAGAGPRR